MQCDETFAIHESQNEHKTSAASTYDADDEADHVADGQSSQPSQTDEIKNKTEATALLMQELESLHPDPALWQVDLDFQEAIVKKSIDQNISTQDFSKSERDYKGHVRYLTKTLFEKTLVNGEKVNREWLVYSPSTGCVFCVPCKVFGERNDDNIFKTGYSDWKNGHDRVKSHENSSEHRNSIQIWYNRASVKTRIDQSLVAQVEVEKQYWRAVLKRTVEVIRYCVQGPTISWQR